MSRLLPLRTEPDVGSRDPRLVDLAGDDAEEVFEALSSITARRILQLLHEEPRPASEIAEAVDTSVQNVQYHIGKLQAADLVEVVDTWYSATGTEMKVYAPSDEALVLVAGGAPVESLRRVVERLLGAILPVVIGAVAALQWIGDASETPAETGANVSVAIEEGRAAAGTDPTLVAGALVLGGLLAVGGYLAVARMQA